jgi:GNAT superfamily N-acetyltransferase
MDIRIAELSEKNVKDTFEWGIYPYSCKYCLYWECPEEALIKEEAFNKKVEWLRRVKKEFGDCGKLVYVDGKNIAYAQFAPSEFLPNINNYEAGVPDKEAVIISCLFVEDKNYRRMGIGRKLLSLIVDDFKLRGVKILETFARKGNSENPSGPCDFYIKKGFSIYKDDLEFPLMRLDL